MSLEFLENKSRTEWSNLIQEYVFNETDRKILTLRLLDGKTFSEIEDELNLSESTIKHRHYKILNKFLHKIDTL